MVMGRPSKYKAEFCEKVIEHMASGLSFECFGATIDVSRAIVYQWANPNSAQFKPDFLEAKKIGWEKCQHFYEKAGLNGMQNAKEFNTGVWVYNMKNRFRKTDTWSPVEEQTKQTIEINLAYDKENL